MVLQKSENLRSFRVFNFALHPKSKTRKSRRVFFYFKFLLVVLLLIIYFVLTTNKYITLFMYLCMLKIANIKNRC